ncbi:hypothetical protein QT998_24720 [Microcoleus sp. S1D4]
MVIGYWLLVIGCWLFVIGYWLFVIGYWLFVIRKRRDNSQQSTVNKKPDNSRINSLIFRA